MKAFEKIGSRYLKRAAGAVAALALAALLGGCVVYPVGYYGPHPYWHGGYYYR